MRMAPSGGPSPRTWGPGRGRLRWSSAGPTWVSDLGGWERLLLLAQARGVQARGVQLGMTFLDGTSIRAHHKAAGAEKRGPTARHAMSVRRWAARGAATAPRPA